MDGIAVYGFKSIKEVYLYLAKQQNIVPVPFKQFDLSEEGVYEYDFNQIKGQEASKRALEIAASGAHNVLIT